MAVTGFEKIQIISAVSLIVFEESRIRLGSLGRESDLELVVGKSYYLLLTGVGSLKKGAAAESAL